VIHHNTLLVEFEIQQREGPLEVISGGTVGTAEIVGDEAQFSVAGEQEFPLFFVEVNGLPLARKEWNCSRSSGIIYDFRMTVTGDHDIQRGDRIQIYAIHLG